MDYQEILLSTERYVTSLFTSQRANRLDYHNLEHARYVVKAARKIGKQTGLNKQDLFLVKTAAWFHDVGFTVTNAAHEQAGAEIARRFLSKEQLGDDLISEIVALILITQVPQEPHSLAEQVICDADLYHLSKKGFYDRSKLLWRETEFLQQRTIIEKEWLENTLSFMEKHHFHTPYGLSELKPGKGANIVKFHKRLEIIQQAALTESIDYLDKKKHKETEKIASERGIDTMFRTTSSNNQRLSDMADNKAHILITVNSIILSAIISLLIRKLDEYTYLTYPTFLLLSVSLVSIIFSILATRPAIPNGIFSQEDLDTERVNLLFFGNFYHMPLNAYLSGMHKVMNSSYFLYNTMITDVYGQGVVLGKKYKFLRLAYNFFMFGLIVAVIAFVAASIWHHPLPVKSALHIRMTEKPVA